MTPLSCEVVEERLLAGDLDDSVRQHLVECNSCRELHEGLVALVPFRTPQPPVALVALARARAGAELRVLRALRRRAQFSTGFKVLLAFVVALPAVLAIHALLASAFELTVGSLLSGAVLVAAEIAGGALSLVALSTAAFLLILAAGAASRPPRTLET